MIESHFGKNNRANPKLSSDYSSYLEVVSNVGKVSVRPKFCKLIQRVQGETEEDLAPTKWSSKKSSVAFATSVSSSRRRLKICTFLTLVREFSSRSSLAA